MSSRHANHLDAKAPSAASVSSALKRDFLSRWTLRVYRWRCLIVILVVPIAEPFADVACHVIQSISIWWIARHLHGAITRIVGFTGRDGISIGILLTIQAAACRVFPFRFGWQPHVDPIGL